MRRRRLLLAVLFSTTILSAPPAEAGPVLGWVAGAAAAAFGATVGAGTAAALGAGAVAAGTAFGSTVLGGFAVKAVISLGVMALAQSLIPDPKSPSMDAEVSYAQTIHYMERVYGKVRKGGPWGFSDYFDGGRYYTTILAAHPVEGIVQHYFDERPVTLGAYGECLTRPPGDEVYAIFYDGSAGQAADAALVAYFSGVTAAHDMEGLSYIRAAAYRQNDPEKFSEDFPTGREPKMLPVMEGHSEIYDPRTQTYGYTDNLALILAHELTEYWGLTVDWDQVAIEAAVCDETVVNRDGEMQARWTANGWFSDNQEFTEVQANLMAAGDVFMWEGVDGVVGFHVGRWIEPTVTLIADDFLEIADTAGGDIGTPNHFIVQYPDPSNSYADTQSGTYEWSTEERRVTSEVAISFVNNHNQASRLNKRFATQSWAEHQISATIGLMGYELIGERFFTIEHEEAGISNTFEVVKLTRNSDGNSFALEARSVGSEDFDFVAASEEPEPTTHNADSSTSYESIIPAPTGLAGEAVSSGTSVAEIRWTWDEQDMRYNTNLRWQKSGATTWEYYTDYFGLNGPAYSIRGLVDGAYYNAQIRNNRSGSWSDWSATVTVQAVANQTPPSALDHFSAVGGEEMATVWFTTPNDNVYAGTRIYRADGSTDFVDADLIATIYGSPSYNASWVDDGLTAGSYSYWAEPINSSGVAGTRSGPETVTVTAA